MQNDLQVEIAANVENLAIYLIVEKTRKGLPVAA
jgi:hypothetical protein